MKPVLLSFEQIIELAAHFRKMQISDDMSDYEHGIVDGIEFIFHLYERCEK